MDKLDPSHELEEPEGLQPDHELPTSSGLDPEHELPSGQNQRIGGGENSENSEKSENSETHNLAQTREIREGKIHSEEEQLKEKVNKLDAKRPKLVWISIALLGVLLILGVFFYIISGRMSKHNQDMVPPVSPTPHEVSPTGTNSKWITYTNLTDGYSIQYPSKYMNCPIPAGSNGFKLTEGSQCYAGEELSPLAIDVTPLTTKSSFARSDYPNCYTMNQEPVSIAGTTGIKYTTTIVQDSGVCNMPSSYARNKVVVVIQHENRLYVLTYWQNTDADLKNQMLASMKFITSPDTTNWHSYPITEAGFTIKYPPDWNGTMFPKEPKLENVQGGVMSPEGSVDFSWGTTGGGGGCETPETLVIGGTKYSACHYVNETNEVWSFITPNADSTYWIQVTAKAFRPTAQNMPKVLNVLSTFQLVPGSISPTTFQSQVLCTQEVKQCPDGSYVGRTEPNCAFAACPGN